MKIFRSYLNKKVIFAMITVIVVVVAASISMVVKRLPQETVYISGTLAEKSIDDLYEQSALIVFGEITGKSEAFQIQNVSGSIANFTDYYFKINSTLRGSTENNIVTVRVQGGTVGNYTEVYEFSPDFEMNHEYLLFLYKPGRGGAYNTEGDYYYVLGLTQGSFSEDSSGNFVSEHGEVISEVSLISALAENDLEPVDENYFRKKYIENQQRNLKNGFITQEEFDNIMENIDHYATIISIS